MHLIFWYTNIYISISRVYIPSTGIIGLQGIDQLSQILPVFQNGCTNNRLPFKVSYFSAKDQSFNSKLFPVKRIWDTWKHVGSP